MLTGTSAVESRLFGSDLLPGIHKTTVQISAALPLRRDSEDPWREHVYSTCVHALRDIAGKGRSAHKRLSRQEGRAVDRLLELPLERNLLHLTHSDADDRQPSFSPDG